MALTEHEKEILRQLDRQFTCSRRDRLGRLCRTVSRIVRSKLLLVALLLVILALLIFDVVQRATGTGRASHALPTSSVPAQATATSLHVTRA
jgi:hypothetical protein